MVFGCRFLWLFVAVIGLSWANASPLALASFAAPGVATQHSKAMTGPSTDARLKLSADQQSFDEAGSKSILQGKVVVRYKNLQVNGSKAIIDLDAAHSPSIAHFINRPTARRYTVLLQARNNKPANTTLTDILVANTIHVYLGQNSMRAEGDAVSDVVSVAADPFHITSDVQQFDNQNKSVAAIGSVVVDYQQSRATSPRALLQINPQGKAEKVVFLDGARLEKPDGTVAAQKITLMVASGNMVAEQHVVTHAQVKNNPNKVAKANPLEATAHAAAPSTVLIKSDYQQYDKAADTMIASGNVHIEYQDYIADGPKATFKLNKGALDQIVLLGRSTIIDKDRTVTGDRIVITTNPKHFDAYGNVKSAFVTKSSGDDSISSSPKALQGAKTPIKGVKPSALPTLVTPSEADE
jgi:lipopolysaccharide export system protein LptA